MSVVSQAERDLLELRAFQTMDGAINQLHTLSLTPNVDPELLIKIVNSKIGEIGKAIPEKKVNPYDGLPTVNITFINGARVITVDPPVEDILSTVEMVEEVPLAEQDLPTLGAPLPAPTLPTLPELADEMAALVPTPAMAAGVHVNAALSLNDLGMDDDGMGGLGA